MRWRKTSASQRNSSVRKNNINDIGNYQYRCTFCGTRVLRLCAAGRDIVGGISAAGEMLAA